mmetsp:Transcript_11721/g.26081  ORF Transcript_11721/g.26081 Transcript_11721/m.26081 type:complete len:323 (-) Transcript_11721:1321-2289(-)
MMLVKGWSFTTTALLAVFCTTLESGSTNALSTIPPSSRNRNYYAPSDAETRLPGSYRQNRDGQWWDRPGSADARTSSTPAGTGSFQTYTEMVRENKRQEDRRRYATDDRDYAYDRRGDVYEPHQQRRGDRYFPTRTEEEARRRDDRYWSPRYDRDPYDYYGSNNNYDNRRKHLPLTNVHDPNEYNYGDDYNRYSSNNNNKNYEDNYDYRDQDRRPMFRRYRNQQDRDYYNNDQHVLREGGQYYQPSQRLRPLASVHDRQGPGEYDRSPATWWDQAGSPDNSAGFQTYTDQSMERSRRHQRDWPRGRHDSRDYQGVNDRRGYY